MPSAIKTNADDIATNKSGVATNVSDIKTNADDIATNTSGIATNKSGIKTNKDNIASNLSKINGKQASNTHLTDLADGSLSGSKVGSGINASNITSGIVSESRLPKEIMKRDKISAKEIIVEKLTYKKMDGDDKEKLRVIFGVYENR